METIERRVIPMELRIEHRSDQAPMIVGHAAVFNQTSDDLGGFREVVAPGAFLETLAADDIRALFNHDPSAIIGRNRAGTLRMNEDGTGLRYEIDVPDTQLGRDLTSSIERGDISGNSFGFRTITDEWNMVDGFEMRTLRKVKLFDVGPVTYPAYPQTDLAMRSLQHWRETQTHHRRAVREKMQELAEQSLPTESRVGKAMSGENLTHLHDAMAGMNSIHTGTCDMGADCPMNA